MGKLTILAPAKINPILEVIGKRADGYHDIGSLMQTIALYDTLTFEDADKFNFSCSVPSLQSNDNLAVRAVKLFKERVGYEGNVHVELYKCIPSPAGLGGGSSDAAATLTALNELWNSKCSPSTLLHMAATLGSDVPFFLRGGLALVKGRGDEVKYLPNGPEYWVVLVVPQVSVPSNKTRELYSRLTPSLYSNTHLTERIANVFVQSGSANPDLLFNTFDALAFDAFPGIAKYWNLFSQLAGTNVHLAGSGPSLFTVSSNKDEAEKLGKILSEHGLTVCVASTSGNCGVAKA